MKKFNYPEEPIFAFEGAYPSHGYGGNAATKWSNFSTLTIHEVTALAFGMHPDFCNSYWENKDNYGTMQIAMWKNRMTEIIRAIYAGEIRTAQPYTEITKDTLVHTCDVEKYFKSRNEENYKEKNTLGESERSTMLQIILGMAMHAYSYNPSSNRNTATGANKNSISTGLQSVGLDVSDDTIRKYLNEAKELFFHTKTPNS